MRNKKNIVALVLVVVVAIFVFVLAGGKSTDTDEADNSQGDQSGNQTDSTTSAETTDQAIDRLSEQGEVLTEGAVRKNIVGLWRSLDREGYEVEFTTDGEMIETLGPNRVIGRWELIDYNEGPNEVVGTTAFSEEGVFLRQSLDDGKSSFYYKVVEADLNSLVTIYLHQSGILGFERIR